jgi:hypothetical protein
MFILRATLLISLALCISGLPLDTDAGKKCLMSLNLVGIIGKVIKPWLGQSKLFAKGQIYAIIMESS